MPGLSVCSLVSTGPEQLEPWLEDLRDLADELVLLVDSSAPAATAALARKHGDVVGAFQHPRIPGEAIDHLLRQARGDWILRLDDDELVDGGLAASLPRLCADRELTHYLLPRLWVVRDAEGRMSWLRQCPWYPDPQLRLFRNVRSLFVHPPRAHAHTRVLGDGRLLDMSEGCLLHLDLAATSRLERETKVVHRYGAMSSYTAAEYYLYEDRFDSSDLVPLEDDVAARVTSMSTRRRPIQPVDAGAVDPRVADLEGMIRRAADRADERDVFGAAVLSLSALGRLQTDRGYLVELRLRNTSAGSWRATGGRPGQILTAYHWYSTDGTIVVWDGRRSLLPHRVGAGDEVCVLAGVWTPEHPGRYRLQWDLVAEDVSWFTERGVELPSLEVLVEAADATPAPATRSLPSRQRAG